MRRRLLKRLHGFREISSAKRIRRGLRNYRWQLDPLSWVQLLAVVGVFSVFLLVPLFAVTLNAVIEGGFFTVRWFQFLFSDQFYFPLSLQFTSDFPFISLKGIGGSLYDIVGGDTVFIQGFDMGVIPNSLYTAALTTLLTSIIGFVLAFIFARYKFRGSEILRILLLIPLLSTPFVGAIGLKRMIASEGTLNTVFFDILHIMPFKIEVTGLAALVMVQTLLFYPIVFLNAYASIINIDPTMEEQAENLGASGFKLFRSVTLPLSLPGLEAGSLLVFILSLEDLGTPIVFQGTNANKVMTMQIFQKMFSPVGLITEEATALALTLLIISLVVFVVVRKYVSLRKYAMLTKGGIWRPRTRVLSRKVALLVTLFCLALLFFATLPHFGVVLLAFSGRWTTTPFPEQFTLDNFAYILGEPLTFGSIVNSLTYAGVATVLIVLLGVSAAYLVSRKRVFGMEAIDSLVTMPIAIPGIVIATGLLLVFINTPISPLAGAGPILIVAYMIRKFPFTVRTVFSGIEQTDEALEEAAVNVGASKSRTFLSITIPLVLVNVLAGSMLSFIYSMSEVSTGIVLGDAHHASAPMTWKMLDTLNALAGGAPAAAAMGVILMSLQFVMIVGANLLLRRRAAPLLAV
ncbi:MAG: ABC transporter permease [Candidatus Geothermarchaeales archaeon]